MQGLFTYIYHILLIIAFVRTIEICAHTYRTTNEAWANDCRWMFVFLLIESIGSFAFDMGYISDVTFGFGSILTLLKVTLDAIVYAFLSHLIYDYLDLPHDDSPFILLGFMYAVAALLVVEWLNRRNQFGCARLPKNTFLRWCVYYVLIWLTVFYTPGSQTFIYFQF